MNLEMTSARQAYRFFDDELKRTSRAYESPKSSDKSYWKLLNYCHQVKLLAERRMAIGEGVPTSRGRDELATKCHEVLDTLLETIGLHAHEKELVLDRLSIRLHGSKNINNLLHAEIKPPHAHLVERQAPSLYSASLSGIVTEHLKDAVVIRFNVEGDAEEREFFWKDLGITPDKLPVGVLVIAETRLLMAPETPTFEETQAEMKRIDELVARQIQKWGVNAKSAIGSEPSEEMRRKSDSAWAANQQNP